MSSNRISVGMLEGTVKKLLDQYGDEIRDDLEEAVKNTAKRTAKELRSASPGSGHYKRSWSYKMIRNRFSFEYDVYSKTPGLPHLLENPHLLRNGKYTHPGKGQIVHIYPVWQKTGKLLEEEIERKLGQ